MENTISILSDDEVKTLHRGLNAALNTIIYDLLNGDTVGSMPQAEVVEVVLDADYLETYGGRENKETFKKFRTLPYKEQIKFAKTVFPYKRYGL